jgi:hypothetical protein
MQKLTNEFFILTFSALPCEFASRRNPVIDKTNIKNSTQNQITV